MNGVDKLTQVVAQDGDLFLNSGFINVSYSAGQKSIDYFNQAVGSVGGETDSVTGDAKVAVLPRGKVMFGNTGDYMRQFAKNEDALFFIDDGKINMVKAADPPRGEAVSITPSSGLIGSPKITEDGIEGRCLLNPMFKLNGLVHVESGDTGSAIYKVIKFTHIGDTRGNDWYTEFVGIAQPGTVPVTGSSFNK